MAKLPAIRPILTMLFRALLRQSIDLSALKYSIWAKRFAGDAGITYADISKAQQLLGYKPGTSFKERVRKFVQWYESEERYFGAHAADSHT